MGTGDGIVQSGGSPTPNLVRTAPLPGVRSRNRLMHDGESLELNDAILRHDGEASAVTNNYRNLTSRDRTLIVRFLESL